MLDMKTLIAFLIIMANVSTIFSQRLMPRFGLTIPTITYDTEHLRHSAKYGFFIGLGKEIPKGKYFLVPEISFVVKGDKFTYLDDPSDLTLYYIETSFPLKYKTGFKGINFFILGGPTVGFGIGGKYTVTTYETNTYDVSFNGFDPQGELDRYFGYIDRRMEIGVQLGLGIEILNRIILDFRYEHGLTKLYSDAKRGDYDTEVIQKAKNRLFQLSIIVPFELKQSNNK